MQALDIPYFLEKMKVIQNNILDFLDTEDDDSESFDTLCTYLSKEKIKLDRYDLKLVLKLLMKIANNHKRGLLFFGKLEKIFQFLKEEISTYYSNTELINIFVSNKRVLLYFIKEEIIRVDHYFVKKIASDKYANAKYPQYFAPEINPFINELWFPNKIKENIMIDDFEKETPEYFEMNRLTGENMSCVCRIIRDDLIDEFVTFVAKNNFDLNSSISPSIYETNSLLIKNQMPSCIKEKNIKLIEYAAFFGSIQIFQYLRLNKVLLTPSLWTYTIHSGNPELIHLLEENHIGFEYNSCDKLIIESIKCHENIIANYIIENYMLNDETNINNNVLFFINAVKYFNFAFMKVELICKSYFFYFCKYDYFKLVENFFNESDIKIKINESMIISKNQLIS